MGADTAIRLAIDLIQVPSRVRQVRDGALPEGMETLLRVAVGEAGAIEQAGVWTERPAETLRKAAAFFIEQVLLAEGTDSYRVLGADPASSSDELRRHMALLLRYMHPDVANGATHAVYANRVTYAWNDLKTPARRAAYDFARGARPPRGDDRSGSRANRGARRRRRGSVAPERSLEVVDDASSQGAFGRFMSRLFGRKAVA